MRKSSLTELKSPAHAHVGRAETQLDSGAQSCASLSLPPLPPCLSLPLRARLGEPAQAGRLREPGAELTLSSVFFSGPAPPSLRAALSSPRRASVFPWGRN